MRLINELRVSSSFLGDSGVALRGAIVGLALLLAACGSDDDAAEADAGPNFSVVVGDSPTFDGCGSNGDIVNYAWSIVEAPAGKEADAGKAISETTGECSLTLESTMAIDEVGEWIVELRIDGADGTSSTDEVTVEVTEQ